MGLLDKGPGYTVNDLVWWSGLITGVVVCYFRLTPLGVPRLVSLVVGGAAGIGLGWGLETLYRNSRSPRPPDGGEDLPPY
jgi:hypothetical protein